MATKLRAPTWERYGSCLIKFQETGEITVSFTNILRLILLLEERFQISIL